MAHFDWNAHIETLTDKTIEAVQPLVDNETIPTEVASQLIHFFNAVNKYRAVRPQVIQPTVETRPEINYKEETYLNISPNTTVTIPDVMAMDTRPNIHTVRLSFGFVNLDHVAMLDVKERTLYIQGIQRELCAEDVRRMVYAMKLYSKL